ncbi:unnamed protein product [Oppiella nova]|uniref:Uncharacterized protein n=1 Tax=Oppiella nova TaxID=334625 RepID=A0A7R9MHE0_9ACAR|nr:unnamed protein product [Oppiella nova]CAG2176442.1 unnamed protein product [Oppiella nova]
MKNQDDLMALLMWTVFTFYLDDFLESQTTKLHYWVRIWEQKITAGHSVGTDFLELCFNDLRARMNKVLSEKLIVMHNSWYMKYLNFHVDTDKVKNGEHLSTFKEYDTFIMLKIFLRHTSLGGMVWWEIHSRLSGESHSSTLLLE